MLKKYKTLVHSCIIQVKTKKGYRPVTFRNGFLGDNSQRGGVFFTDDMELQKGIESHPLFNNGAYDRIWTDDVEPKKATKAEPVEEPKAEESVPAEEAVKVADRAPKAEPVETSEVKTKE